MLTVDSNGWLKTDSTGDPEIRIVPTHRNYHLLEPPCDGDSAIAEWPLAWIWHTTDLVVAMEKLARRIADPSQKGTSSWTTGIARDGVIWQSAPLTVGTWHVGNPGTILGRRVQNVNRCTGSTELESPGRLLPGPDGALYSDPYYRVDPATGRPGRAMGFDPACRLPDRDPYGQPYVNEIHQRGADPYTSGLWPRFTDAQVAGGLALVRAASAWRPPALPANAPPPLASTASWQYGHVDFPGRTGKEDPGPLFPPIRDTILANVFGHQ